MPNKQTGADREKLGLAQDFPRFRARNDMRWTEPQAVLEMREHCSAKAFVKGRRWYANQLLGFQSFPDRRFACSTLLRSSRRLIEQSHHLIFKSKNTLAFSRGRTLAN